MGTKFKLLSGIQTQQTAVLEQADELMQRLNDMGVMAESVLHVLANIAAKAEGGQPVEAASAESLASFMAGVEALAQRLPDVRNEKTKRSILSIMSNAGINPDGTVTANVQQVAELGKGQKELYTRYIRAFKMYELSLQRNRPAGQQLARAAKRVQQIVDQAVRVSTSRRPEVPVRAAPNSTI